MDLISRSGIGSAFPAETVQTDQRMMGSRWLSRNWQLLTSDDYHSVSSLKLRFFCYEIFRQGEAGGAGNIAG